MSTEDKPWYMQEWLPNPHWHQLKTRILEQRGHRCESCGSDQNLVVNHRTFVRIGKELDEDMQVSCKTCYQKMGGIG